MVAPYEIGNPVRSFIRVPGSGSDKNAKALSWDLSRSSSVAAAAPVQQTFPPENPTASLKQTASSGGNTGGNSEERELEAPSQTEDASQNSSSANPPARGCKRGYVDEPRTEDNLGSGGPSSAKSARVCLKLSAKSARVCQNSKENRSVGSGTNVGTIELNELAEVKEERDQLRQENQELKAKMSELDKLRQENRRLEERLTIFHDLFKNKNRLALLLRRLDMHQT